MSKSWGDELQDRSVMTQPGIVEIELCFNRPEQHALRLETGMPRHEVVRLLNDFAAAIAKGCGMRRVGREGS